MPQQQLREQQEEIYGERKEEATPTAPAITELRKFLPKNAEGNPDLDALSSMLQRRGKKNWLDWAELSDSEKQAIHDELRPQGRNGPATDLELQLTEEEARLHDLIENKGGFVSMEELRELRESREALDKASFIEAAYNQAAVCLRQAGF